MASTSRSQELLIKLLNTRQDRQRQGLPPLTQTQLDEVAKVNGYRDFDQFSRSISYLATGQAETDAQGDIGDKMREWFGGLTFELADNLEGVFRSVVEDRPLSDVMEQIQIERQNYQTTNPGEATALQISGGLTTPVSPGMGVAKVAPTLAKGVVLGGRQGQLAQKLASTVPAQGAVMGATDAAAYSAFSGNDVGQIGSDALTGAVVGAPLAKLGNVVGEYGGKAYQFGKEQLGKVLNAGSGSSGRVARAIDPLTYPELRDVPIERRIALEEIRNRNELGNMPTDQYRQQLGVLEEANKADRATFLDVANRVGGSDNPIYAATDAIMFEPSLKAQFGRTIVPRQEKDAVLNAIREDFSDTMGRQLNEQQINTIADNAARKAQPLYDQADPQVVFQTPRIQNYLDEDYVQDAYRNYRGPYVTEQKALGVINPKPLPVSPSMPMEVRTLDAIQKGVRRQEGLDRLDASPKRTELDTSNLRKVQQLALDDAGAQVPKYREARRIYAVGQGIDEFEQGVRDINSTAMTPYKVLGRYESLKDGIEKEAYRSGAVDAVIRKFDRSTADMPNLAKTFRNNELMKKLRVLFPTDAAFQEFLKRSRMEDTLADSARLGSGSQTTPRAETLKEMRDSNIRPSDLLNPKRVVDRMFGDIDDQVQRSRDSTKFQNIGEVTLGQGPDNINRSLNQLDALDRMRLEQMRLGRYGQGAGSRSGILGVDPETREGVISLLF